MGDGRDRCDRVLTPSLANSPRFRAASTATGIVPRSCAQLHFIRLISPSLVAFFSGHLTYIRRELTAQSGIVPRLRARRLVWTSLPPSNVLNACEFEKLRIMYFFFFAVNAFYLIITSLDVQSESTVVRFIFSCLTTNKVPIVSGSR